MNKRIRKKKAKMRGFHLGDHVYPREYIECIHKRQLLYTYLVPRWKEAFKVDVKILHKTNMKRALKQCIKDMRHTRYLLHKYLRFARHLEVKPEFKYPKPIPLILDGEHIGYASSAFIPIKETMNSCEAASMEVD